MSNAVSVVTLHKDRPAHLLRLLEGLAASKFGGEVVIAEMGARTPLPPSPLSITQIDVEAGRLPLARARNVGRAAANGTDLVFLDVDCIPALDMIGVLTRELEQHDALICAQVRYLTNDVSSNWTYSQLLDGSVPHSARQFPAKGICEAPHAGLFWSLAFGVRADTFDRLGSFDETFTGYGGEDTDFAFRARNEGIPVLLSADALAFHQPHESCDPPLQHFADIMRNASIFHARHRVWPMQGWLTQFVALGLVEQLTESEYRILRSPTAAEISAATRRGAY